MFHRLLLLKREFSLYKLPKKEGMNGGKGKDEEVLGERRGGHA